MAVPKRKTSRSKKNSRRSHIKSLKPINISQHHITGQNMLSHHISVDGYYGDRQVIKKKK